jgi:hypothetical protein
VGHVDEVERIAELLRARNAVDALIADATGRPMASGHLGEWLAFRIFGLTPALHAAVAGFDGTFGGGPLDGRTVNVKWYLNREGLLDIAATGPDYYLVMTGQPAPAVTSRGTTRPWCIDEVFLFETARLEAELRARGVALGTATSVRAATWRAAQVYPEPRNPALVLDERQRWLLGLFATPPEPR